MRHAARTARRIESLVLDAVRDPEKCPVVDDLDVLTEMQLVERDGRAVGFEDVERLGDQRETDGLTRRIAHLEIVARNVRDDAVKTPCRLRRRRGCDGRRGESDRRHERAQSAGEMYGSHGLRSAQRVPFTAWHVNGVDNAHPGDAHARRNEVPGLPSRAASRWKRATLWR